MKYAILEGLATAVTIFFLLLATLALCAGFGALGAALDMGFSALVSAAKW